MLFFWGLNCQTKVHSVSALNSCINRQCSAEQAMCCKHGSTLTIQNANTFVITDHVFAEPIFWWNLASSTNNKEMRTYSTNFWISTDFLYVCSANTLVRYVELHQCSVMVRYKGQCDFGSTLTSTKYLLCPVPPFFSLVTTFKSAAK